MIRHAIRGTLAASLLAAILALPVVVAQAAEPAPAWKLSWTSSPTNFAPGATHVSYALLALNVGGAPTSGPVTVSDTLPEGLIPIEAYSVGSEPPEFPCAIAAQEITCTYPKPVKPGWQMEFHVSADVGPELSQGDLIANQVLISEGGALPAQASVTTEVTSALPAFELLEGPSGLSAAFTDRDGSVVTQAGAHPYDLTVDLGLPSVRLGPNTYPAEGGLRDALVVLPRGTIVDPSATPVRCEEAQLETSTCPDASAVGRVKVSVGFGQETSVLADSALFNMVPPPGVAAALAFDAGRLGIYTHLLGGLRAGDYALQAASNDILSRGATPALTVRTTIWGDPSSPSHDSQRGEKCSIGGDEEERSCPVAPQGTPFLTTPTECNAPAAIDTEIDSWYDPGTMHRRSALLSDLAGEPVQITGCNQLEFEPTLIARPTTNLADSPSGLEVDLHIPQAPAASLVGQAYVCSKGTWQDNPTAFSYRWLRNGTPIPGASSAEYTTQGADAGAALQCEVEARNAATGAAFAVSDPLVLQPGPGPSVPTHTNQPLVSGTVTSAGGTLTCSPGSWQGSPTFSYRWLENGSLVPGQTNNTYAVPAGKAPLTVQCEAIATNAAGITTAYSPNATSEPPPSPALPSYAFPPHVFLPAAGFGLAGAHLRDAVVTLPEGLVINPSGANGLGACSPAQIGIDPRSGIADANPAHCPDASKVGTVEVDTPLLEEPPAGAVYLATPHDNPFDSLLALYIAVEDPERGVVVKLAGEVQADPVSGRLRTSFAENPQLPFEDFKLHFFGGAAAPLRTPALCGTYSTTSSLTPWSAPESGPPATPSDTYAIERAPGGAPCPSAPGALPNAPSFGAGTISPQAGAYSPTVVNLHRPDGSQEIASLSLTPPPGLLGKLAGTPYCPEAALARAAVRSGRAEQAEASCPAASRVGSVEVAAGAGPTPYNATGTAYLAGPYKGAPISIAIITPATAGPYDLGTVVVRAALHIDPATAQISALSDPIPQILQGIPLDVRQIAVKLDRPSFSLNPTSCDPMSFAGRLVSTLGQGAALTSPFQVGGCKPLPFKPKLGLRLKGGTKRASHPKLIATLKAKPGEANIAAAQVKLPPSAFLDQAHIRTICTRVQFAADACPKGSIYGSATAITPLLDYPLSGDVYLRSSNHKLPDLVVALKGPASQPIEIDLAGKTDSVKGALSNSFEALPDAPVSSFRLELFGGRRGLVVNSRDLCAHAYRAEVKLEGQNGKSHDTSPAVGTDCKPKRGRG